MATAPIHLDTDEFEEAPSSSESKPVALSAGEFEDASPSDTDIDYSHPAGGSAPAVRAHPAVDMKVPPLFGVDVPTGAREQVKQGLRESYEQNPGPLLSAGRVAGRAVGNVISGAKDIGQSAAADFERSGGNPFYNGGKTTPEIAKQAQRGARELITGGSTGAIALSAPELMELGIAADAGDVAAKAAIIKILGAAEVGNLASEGAGAAADKLNLSPETKDLIQTAAFFLPSLGGVLGFKGGVGVDAEGNPGVAAQSPGGKVTVGARGTPEAYEAGLKVGDMQMGFRVPRGGRSAPAAPDPVRIAADNTIQSAAQTIQQAAALREAAANIVQGKPPVPPPPSEQVPESLQGNTLTPKAVADVASVIKAAPQEMQGKLALEAHEKLADWMLKTGRFVGPDGSIQVADSPEKAAALAQKVINDEVSRQQKVAQDRLKQQEVVQKEQEKAEAERQKQVEAQQKEAEKAANKKDVNGLTPAERTAARVKTLIESNPERDPIQIVQRVLGITPERAQQLVDEYRSSKAPKVGQGADATVEESRATIDHQVQALAEGRIPAVMLPEGSKYRPAPPPGMKVMAVRGDVPGAGFYIYNPAKVQAATIRSAAKAGTHGDLLGHIQGKQDMAEGTPTVVVQAKAPDGTPIQDSQVQDDPELVQRQTEILHERHPDAHIEVTSPEKVIEDRQAANAEGEPVALADGEFEDAAEEGADAVQESGTGEVLRGEQGEAGEPGSGREGVGESDQGQAPSGASGEEETERPRLGEVAAGSSPIQTKEDQLSAENKEPAAGELAEGAPAQPKYKFGNTQADIPPESEAGRALEEARKAIDANDLGGEKGLETEPHITVRYGIRGDDLNGIREYLKRQAPFEAKLGKTEAFPPSEGSDGSAVIQAPILSPELHRMNAEIDKEGDFEPSSFPDYKPHATIAYVKPEAASKYVGMDVTEGKTFRIDSVSISDRNGDKEVVKLEGEPTAVKPEMKPAKSETITKGDEVLFTDRNGNERTGTVAHAGERIMRIKSEGKEYTVAAKKVRPASTSATSNDVEKPEAVAKAAEEYLSKQLPEAVARYVTENTTGGTLKISSDAARELLPGYSTPAERTANTYALGPASSKLAAAVWDRGMERGPEPGQPVLEFLTGSPGSGKTSSFVSDDEDSEVGIISEGMMDSFPISEARINQAIEHGFVPTITLVYANDPRITLRRAVERAMKYGRPVRIGQMSRLYVEIPKNVARLAEHFGERLAVTVYDNSIDGKLPSISSLEDVLQMTGEYTVDTAREALQDELDKLRDSGKISPELYDKFAVLRPADHATAGGTDSGGPGDAGIQEAPGEDQPRREGSGAIEPGGTEYLSGALGFHPSALKPLVENRVVAPIIEALKDEAEHVAISRDLHNSLYDLQSQDNAAVLRVVQLLKSMPGTARDQEAIYHHMEDPNLSLTDHQQDILDNYLTPLIYQAEHDFQIVTEGGVPLENYVHRQVRERGGLIDRLLERAKEKVPSSSVGGGRLSKSAPAAKQRSMMAAVDPSGKRVVISIKGNEVSGWKGGESFRMGKIRPGSKGTQEYYDKHVMEKLEKLASDLGISHDRVTKGMPGNVLGVSYTGQSRIKTKAATPEQVILHEIGHQLDERYSLQNEFIKDSSLKEEMRKLADLRFEGQDVSNYYQRYVRKGAEKIAVMFEAYLHAPERFREVAPKTYDKFVEFLGQHDETRPILEIKPSMVIGSRKVGAVEAEPDAFVDKDGKKWKIVQATTKEIEAATPVRYHHNAAASAAVNFLTMDKARRAYEFLEEFKASPEFKEYSHAFDTPGSIPKGWKTTQLPQFRGYFFEPHIAEVLDQYAARIRSNHGLLSDVYGKVNQFLRTSIFFNPLIHIPNLLNHWVVEKGVSGLANPANYPVISRAGIRAINAVIHQNKDFLEALDAGAPLQSQQFETKQLADLFFKKMQDELGDPESSKTKEMAKALGMAPARLVKAIYDLSGKATWYVNDIAFLQSTYEKMERGMSLKDALTETGKHIPEYRYMTRIFDSPELGSIMSNSAITMFGAYHYGALKSYGQMAKSLAGFNWTDAGTKNEHGEPTNSAGRTQEEEKLHGLDTLAMMALVTFVVYPMMDKVLKWATGNDMAQFRRAGASTFVYNLAMLAKGEKTPTEFASSVATPAPLPLVAAELGFNRDLRTGQRIYDEHAKGKELAGQVGRRIAASVAPVEQGLQVAEGRTDWRRMLYSMVGVGFPLHGAQKLAAQITAQNLASLPPRSEKEIAHAVRRSRALHDAWAGDRSRFDAIMKSSDYTPKEKLKLRKDLLTPPLVYATKGLTYKDAIRVYRAATPEEKKLLHPLMAKKLENLMRSGKDIPEGGSANELF